VCGGRADDISVTHPLPQVVLTRALPHGWATARFGCGPVYGLSAAGGVPPLRVRPDFRSLLRV
jgi:hypothetical protein